MEAYLKHRGVPVRYDFRVASDSKGCIWIYKGQRLWLLNEARHRVTYCYIPKRFGHIVSVAQARDKVVITTKHRVFLSSAGKMQLKAYATPPVPIEVMQDYLRMVMTHNGNLWLTTSEWMLLYQRKTHSWKWVNNFMRTSFLTISLLPNDHLLVGTTREGIMEYDEEGWQLIDNFRISLSHLSYGSHKISIEEMDPMSGARTEYLLATIHVAYPLYLSWWAVLLYILVFAGAIVLTYSWYHRRQEYKFELRERDMKLKFFTDISHALRMPLSLVMGPIEDLLLTVKDKDTHQVLDLVHQNIKRLAFLVNKTLDFRKLEDAEMHQTVLYDDELAKQVVIRDEAEAHETSSDNNKTEENKEQDTILIVEDSVELLSFLAHVLGREYHVCQATDGQQALDILKTTPVDIIVSDVTMEGMNGLDLCHRVKTDIAFSHIPVILLTARSLASDELRGLEMGADDYITKPFNIDILRHRIRYLLDRTMTARERFAQATDVAASEITETTLDEQMLQKAMDIVKAHLSDTSFTADDLARELGMARTNVYKKLQFITGKTPAAFIRTIRLKHGRQMLEHDPKLFVSQVAYECGFANPKLFSRYFKDEFGIYPKEIKG